MVDVNVEGISYENWADADPDQIIFVWVTEEGEQLVLRKEAEVLAATEEPPIWLKWNIKSQ